MNLTIPDSHKAADIVATVKAAEPGAVLCCSTERQFALLKIALVKLQKSDLTVQLVDEQGYLVRQVRTRRREEPGSAPAEAGLSRDQALVVKRLEEAFALCRKHKLLVVGFSDSLVAVPESLGAGLDILSSTAAAEIDAAEAYRGYEADGEG